MVDTSRSAGTLVKVNGFAVSRAAHMIGKAAFFAPEIRISPSSGFPPTILSLSTAFPFVRRQRLHRQRVDLLAHAIAERRIDELVALHPVAAGKLGRHDERLEMLAVAHHLDMLAAEARLDAALHALRGNQFRFSL